MSTTLRRRSTATSVSTSRKFAVVSCGWPHWSRSPGIATHRLLNQTLVNPVGDVYVYSDLSFITLQYVVGTLAKNLGYVTPDMLLPACNYSGTGSLLRCVGSQSNGRTTCGSLIALSQASL